MPRQVFYVRYRDGRWIFGRGDTAFEAFDRKQAAIERARAVVARADDVELLILNKDGRADTRYHPKPPD